jgi:hypothetical protein
MDKHNAFNVFMLGAVFAVPKLSLEVCPLLDMRKGGGCPRVVSGGGL